MRNVTVTRKVSLSLTAEEWQLYTDKPRVKTVARSINNEIASCINTHPSRSEARFFARKVLNEYSEFGANDSEPWGVLEDILMEVYPYE